jgi:hypothetical protein
MGTGLTTPGMHQARLQPPYASGLAPAGRATTLLTPKAPGLLPHRRPVSALLPPHITLCSVPSRPARAACG